MKWAFDTRKKISAEHLQKAEKHRISQEKEAQENFFKPAGLGKRAIIRHAA